MTIDEAIKWLDFKSGDIYDHVFYGDEAPEWEDYEYEALRMAIETLKDSICGAKMDERREDG